ncbi:hypothetical protein Scep_000333 [Stephania cephalantha]|uniref:Signal peptidase complex catalytic subunit SEC11 n=1 Tax=Stephania cephalantha TaxID=152367 RepID=A0AAP0Q2C4_9MAGN
MFSSIWPICPEFIEWIHSARGRRLVFARIVRFGKQLRSLRSCIYLLQPIVPSSISSSTSQNLSRFANDLLVRFTLIDLERLMFYLFAHLVEFADFLHDRDIPFHGVDAVDVYNRQRIAYVAGMRLRSNMLMLQGYVLVLHRKGDAFRVGEIISFDVKGGEIPFVRRIIKVYEMEVTGKCNILTKGDHNGWDDRLLYAWNNQHWLQPHHIIGKATWVFPYVGLVKLAIMENVNKTVCSSQSEDDTSASGGANSQREPIRERRVSQGIHFIAAQTRHTPSISSRTATVDMPRDACSHRLPDFRTIRPTSPSPRHATWEVVIVVLAIETGKSEEPLVVCGNCGECFHPTYACPYSKYKNHHGSTYASPQPNFYMSKRSPQIPQHEKRPIRDMMNDLIFENQLFNKVINMNGEPLQDIERNMISDWLSQSTTQTLAEDMQDMKSNVEFDKFSIVDEHLSEPEETLDVSSHEPDITIAQYDDDEAEKEIEVISKRSDEPQKENKEDQPLVLVKPPTLPCIFVRPCKGVDVKERSRIFYTADTFVLDDHDSTDSFVLEVPNELPIQEGGVHDALPKYVDAPFVVDISKGEGIT